MLTQLTKLVPLTEAITLHAITFNVVSFTVDQMFKKTFQITKIKTNWGEFKTITETIL